MKNTLISFLFLMLVNSTSLYAQDTDLLEWVPETKEDFVKSERAVLNTIDWLESNSLDWQVERRKKQYMLFMEWITKSPTVTIEVMGAVVNFTDKNPDLLFIFMAGWTRYSLLNSYSTDKVKGNLAGIESAINVYKRGTGMKKDKHMEKIIALQESGKLEAWISEQLAEVTK